MGEEAFVNEYNIIEMSLFQVLVDDGTCTPWKLTTVDENKPLGRAPHFCQVILQSKAFHIFVLVLVVSDAVIASTYNTVQEDWLYWSQVRYCCNAGEKRRKEKTRNENKKK